VPANDVMRDTHYPDAATSPTGNKGVDNSPSIYINSTVRKIPDRGYISIEKNVSLFFFSAGDSPETIRVDPT
jgi:hypothetical protein